MKLSPLWSASIALVLLSRVAFAQSEAPGDSSSAPEKKPPVAPPGAMKSSEGEAETAKLEESFKRLLNRPGGLTAEDAAEQASSYSLEARLAQQDLKSAEAQETKTKYEYAPRLSLTASYTRKSVPGGGESLFGEGGLVGSNAPAGPLPAGTPLFGIPGDALNFQGVANHYYLNAGLVIPISDYLLNMSAAFAGVDAAKKTAQLNEQAARVNAAANARLMYYEWTLARLRRAEAEMAIGRANEQLESLKVLLAAGRVARSDMLRQDAFVARTELALRRTSVRESVAAQNLHAIMTGGEGRLPKWAIGEDVLSGRPGDEIKNVDMESLQQEAVRNRLEIQALENTVYALNQKSSVQRSRAYPRLEGFGNLTYANPNQIYFPTTNEWNPSWDLGIRLTWTINDLGAHRADARSTDAEAAQVRTKKRQIADQLRTEVLTATRSMEEASLAQDSAKRGLLAAEAAYTDLSQLFQHGRSTSLDVLQSETALLNARLELIESYVALRMARVRFDYALGRDTRK